MGDYRVHISVRRRYNSINDSTEIKTELCNDLDEVLLNAVEFIEETINALEDEGSEDDTN